MTDDWTWVYIIVMSIWLVTISYELSTLKDKIRKLEGGEK